MNPLLTIHPEDRINSHPIIKWYYNLGDLEYTGTYDYLIYEGNAIEWDNCPEDDDSWEAIEDLILFLYDEAADGGLLYTMNEHTIIIAPYETGTGTDYQWGIFKPHSHERQAGGYCESKEQTIAVITRYLTPQKTLT
jgi:hypothetical protein